MPMRTLHFDKQRDFVLDDKLTKEESGMLEFIKHKGSVTDGDLSMQFPINHFNIHKYLQIIRRLIDRGLIRLEYDDCNRKCLVPI